MYVHGYSATYEIPTNYLLRVSSSEKTAPVSPPASPTEGTQADCALCRHTSFPHSHEDDQEGVKKTGKTEDTEKLKSPFAKELADTDQKEVEQLKKRDMEVRQHEAAHKAAGGSLAGAPHLEYKQGPDGQQYAVEGSVPINTSKGRTPEETISRAEIIRRAALAPQNPSSADRKVAADASKMEAEARSEISKRSLETIKNTISPDSSVNRPDSPSKPDSSFVKDPGSGAQTENTTSHAQKSEKSGGSESVHSFAKRSLFGTYEQSRDLGRSLSRGMSSRSSAQDSGQNQSKKLESGRLDFLG